MSDLISREELLKQIETDSKGHEGQYGDEWLFIDTINSIPTAEPKVGKWISNHDGSWNCSECGLRVLIYAKGNYCPNCGSYNARKMERSE